MYVHVVEICIYDITSIIDIILSSQIIAYVNRCNDRLFYFITADAHIAGAGSEVISAALQSSFADIAFLHANDSYNVEVRSPCIFSFVRDPMTRWISSYAEIEFFIKKNPLEWSKFVLRLPAKLRFTEYEEGSTLRVKVSVYVRLHSVWLYCIVSCSVKVLMSLCAAM